MAAGVLGCKGGDDGDGTTQGTAGVLAFAGVSGGTAGVGFAGSSAGAAGSAGVVAGTTAGAGAGTGVDASIGEPDAGMPIMPGGALVIPADCPTPNPNQPPDTLRCTGLYEDIASKKLAPGAVEFAPAVALWSDGAEKTRWIYLPPGQTIDVSNPDAWKFPLDTRFWKEFRSGGKRVETRMFWKVSATYWARTAYKWSTDESSATRSGGEDVQVNGASYHIPSTTECDQCHKGRVDRALGFEAILLGLTGATGLTLAELQKAALLSGSVPSAIAIGDDGTGHGSEALGWLHVNCGVSCHNDNPAAEGYTTGMRLALKLADAGGGNTSQAQARVTTLGVGATTARWQGQTRIAPGNPGNSLLHSLMSTRNPGSMKDQMPPIASRVVPQTAATLISDWIAAMQ